MDSVFSINNLVCSYNREANNKVLEINNLEIPAGKITFLLGASGSGKSTLLETLGLMNNTIASGDVVFNISESEKISFKSLWSSNDDTKISDIRKKHLSFIFQNTNLMDNFSAYENICLSRMIKENIAEAAVMDSAKDLMKKVNLPQNEVNETTLAVNLSGGQRQRLAFVRALNTNTTVLLGDEPTGNLDESNANELLGLIKSNLKNNLSAIIVSHDINLALNHADRIVVLTKDKAKGVGEVLAQNILDRETWEKYSAEEIRTLKEKIKNLFQTNLDSVNTTGIEKATKKKSYKSYRQLFLSKESKAIAGKSFVNLLILSGILFFTFLSIGFANGCLNYLDKKLNSVFVNWLSISIPYAKSGDETISKIKKALADPALKTKFDYSSISTHKEFNLFFYNLKDASYEAAKTRTVDIETDGKLLTDYILGQKNMIRGDKNFRNKEDLSIIVSQKLLTNLGYDANASYIDMREYYFDTLTQKNNYYKVPIAIRAVVNELPGKNVAACPESFYKAYTQHDQNPFEIINRTNYIQYFISGDEKDAIALKTKLQTFFKSNHTYEQYQPEVSNTEPHNDSYQKGYDLNISFYDPEMSIASGINDIDNVIQKEVIKDSKNITRIYRYIGLDNSTDISYDYLSIYFNRLDNVRAFADYIYKTFNEANESDRNTIEADTSKIKEKENFYFLSKITYIIAYLVILFGTITVSLFLFNLLKLHLNKVKMNIGTFKAIGLSNKESLSIYFNIIIQFIFTGIIFSLIISFALGTVIDIILQSTQHLEKEDAYFKLLDLNTLVAISIVLVFAIIISWRTISSILSKSPGDLIYNR